MKKIFNNLYLTFRFFLLFVPVAVLFASSFAFDILYPVAQTAFVVALALTGLDLVLLFNRNIEFNCKRTMNKILSLGSENTIKLQIENNSGQTFFVGIIDELPYQLQKRDFFIDLKLHPGERKILNYSIVPPVRGEYNFGKVYCFVSSVLKILERKITFNLDKTVSVYPSIIQMKTFELKAFDKISHSIGIKKIRRIGHSSEFDQIKSYVSGDDYQSINWKASSRRNDLMVNHYEDEKAQNVYSVIDKSRVMKMPFNNLSLLDYAINTSLVISNVALKKNDRAGLITFSDKINTTLKAQNSRNQLKHILEALYREKEGILESNYELLYTSVRKFIPSRSLLFLFTNFESLYGMQRVLPIIRKLNKLHLLVVVFFENTEILEYSKTSAIDMEEIYNKTVAQKFLLEKQQIVFSLRQFGIQSILTKPEELALNTLNKYLELKSRGMI